MAFSLLYMKNFPSIKKNSDFQIVYKNGRSLADRYLVMYVYENGLAGDRLGISASRKVGNSVIRHRLARYLREIFRLNADQTKKGLDIVVVVRPAAQQADYRTIESAYKHLCGRHNILSESK